MLFCRDCFILLSLERFIHSFVMCYYFWNVVHLAGKARVGNMAGCQILPYQVRRKRLEGVVEWSSKLPKDITPSIKRRRKGFSLNTPAII